MPCLRLILFAVFLLLCWPQVEVCAGTAEASTSTICEGGASSLAKRSRFVDGPRESHFGHQAEDFSEYLLRTHDFGFSPPDRLNGLASLEPANVLLHSSFASDFPPELPRTWQFRSRTALYPRAPSSRL